MPIRHTKENINHLRRLLGNRDWRIENLYQIYDEENVRRLFRLKPVQRYLHNNLHDKNLILKSRQHGCTSYIARYFVDDWLFGPPGADTAMIAHTRGHAEKIFEKHVLMPLAHLPASLRERFDIDRSSTDSIRLNNSRPGVPPQWSNFWVTNSARSGNLRNLLISEYGITCDQFPSKAREIKSGSLNTLHAKSMAFIESTAGTAPMGDFHDKSKIAQKKHAAEANLSRLDWKFFFFGWHEDPKNEEEPPLGYKFDDAMVEYFEEQEDVLQKKLTIPQRYFYAVKKEEQGGDIFREHPTNWEECYQVIVEGAIYKKELQRVELEKRHRPIGWDESLPVYTATDIGSGEGHAMATVFFQFDGMTVRFIDWYYNELGGLDALAKYILGKPYVYNRYSHYCPWDAVRSDVSVGGSLLATLGLDSPSRADMMRQLGVNWCERTTLQKTPRYDRIEAGRQLLSRSYFDSDKTGDRQTEGEAEIPGLMTCLRNFQYQWDEDTRTYGRTPLHNWASNGADAYTHAALAIKHASSEFDDDEDDVEYPIEASQ